MEAGGLSHRLHEVYICCSSMQENEEVEGPHTKVYKQESGQMEEHDSFYLGEQAEKTCEM